MKRPTEAQADQASALLMEIAGMASNMEMSCYHFMPSGDDIDHYAMQLQLMRDAMKRVGWLADLCSDTLGGGTVLGGAEAWMAPPMFLHKKGGAE